MSRAGGESSESTAIPASVRVERSIPVQSPGGMKLARGEQEQRGEQEPALYGA